jgi:putative phosphoribosyl transferase
LVLPEQPRGVVLFAQGSAASRPSRRDRFIADLLHRAQLGTAALDLIARDEGEVDEDTRLEWSDIHLLAGRLVIASDWFGQQAHTHDLPLGYLAAGAAASVALTAASERSGDRGGADRGCELSRVKA